MDYKLYEAVFKALADEARLKILHMISSGELCGCEILDSFQFSQATLSYHMKLMTESGLVSCRRDGKKMLYSIAPEWEGFVRCIKNDTLRTEMASMKE